MSDVFGLAETRFDEANWVNMFIRCKYLFLTFSPIIQVNLSPKLMCSITKNIPHEENSVTICNRRFLLITLHGSICIKSDANARWSFHKWSLVEDKGCHKTFNVNIVMIPVLFSLRSKVRIITLLVTTKNSFEDLTIKLMKETPFWSSSRIYRNPGTLEYTKKSVLVSFDNTSICRNDSKEFSSLIYLAINPPSSPL